MALTIGNNIPALMAQRGLTDAGNAVMRSYERLSSGQRINRAADDAAGLAISEALESSARVVDQAARNTTDAISALAIAEQGLRSQQEILQRGLELAEQAANGTFSYTQRKSLQKEYKSLLEEYVRIANTTEFNGQKLLNGSTQMLDIQCGRNGAETSSLKVAMANTATLGGEELIRMDYNDSGTMSTADRLELNIHLGTGSLGPKTIDALADVTKGGIVSYEVVDSSGRMRDVYASINPNQSWVLGLSSGTRVAFLSADGAGNFTLENNVAATIGMNNQLTVTFADNGAQAQVAMDLRDVTLRTWDAISGAPAFVQQGTRRTALYCSGVEGTSRAKLAIETLSNKLEDLSVLSGNIGAVHARLSQSLDVTLRSSLEFKAAAGRIANADMAEESALLLSKQIVQQSASAILAQANQQPALALQVLRS